jgi:hypothetical protein
MCAFASPYRRLFQLPIDETQLRERDETTRRLEDENRTLRERLTVATTETKQQKAFFDRETELLTMLAKSQMTVAGKAQHLRFCSCSTLLLFAGHLAGGRRR